MHVLQLELVPCKLLTHDGTLHFIGDMTIFRPQNQKQNRVLQQRHCVKEDQACYHEAANRVSDLPAEPLDAARGDYHCHGAQRIS